MKGLIILVASSIVPILLLGSGQTPQSNSSMPLVEKAVPPPRLSNPYAESLETLKADQAFMTKRIRELELQINQRLNRIGTATQTRAAIHTKQISALGSQIEETNDALRKIRERIRVVTEDHQETKALAKEQSLQRQELDAKTTKETRLILLRSLVNTATKDDESPQQIEGAQVLSQWFLALCLLGAFTLYQCSNRLNVTWRRPKGMELSPRKRGPQYATPQIESDRPVSPPPPCHPIDSLKIQPSDELIKTYFPKGNALQDIPWTVGHSCLKGNVRTDNQDYAISFEIEGVQFGFVADGVGGLKHGRTASYLAIQSALEATAEALLATQDRSTTSVTLILRLAMQSALGALAQSALTHQINPSDGLRTTLILCAGTLSHWIVFHCGDGGVNRISQSGIIEPLLDPQRDDQNHPDLLTSSLGPILHGKPVLRQSERNTGDILVAGSDGLWDRVPMDFPLRLCRAALAEKGDFSMAAHEILTQMAAYKDQIGYVFDDNLSLIFLGNGAPPNISSKLGKQLLKGTDENLSGTQR